MKRENRRGRKWKRPRNFSTRDLIMLHHHHRRHSPPPPHPPLIVSRLVPSPLPPLQSPLPPLPLLLLDYHYFPLRFNPFLRIPSQALCRREEQPRQQQQQEGVVKVVQDSSIVEMIIPMIP